MMQTGKIVVAARDITEGLLRGRVICKAGTRLRIIGKSGNSIYPIAVGKEDDPSWQIAVSRCDIREIGAIEMLRIEVQVDGKSYVRDESSGMLRYYQIGTRAKARMPYRRSIPYRCAKLIAKIDAAVIAAEINRV